jgi:hypothetical protein
MPTPRNAFACSSKWNAPPKRPFDDMGFRVKDPKQNIATLENSKLFD